MLYADDVEAILAEDSSVSGGDYDKSLLLDDTDSDNRLSQSRATSRDKESMLSSIAIPSHRSHSMGVSLNSPTIDLEELLKSQSQYTDLDDSDGDSQLQRLLDEDYSITSARVSNNLGEISDPLRKEELRLKKQARFDHCKIRAPLSKREKSPPRPETFMKFERLTKAEQIIREHGTSPTCATVSSRTIAVGLGGGSIICFDHFEKPMATLKTVSALGFVTCLDFTPSENYLAAGYQKGAIIIWDMHKQTVAKSMKDAHKQTVTSIFFRYSKELKLISVDALGFTYHWSFSKSIWAGFQFQKSCLFNGNAGQIYDIALLPNNQLGFAKKVPPLAAIVNTQYTVLISLDPIEMGRMLPHRGDKGCVPCLDWRKRVVISDSDDGKEPVNPLLAMGMGPIVSLIEVYPKPGEKLGVALRIIANIDVTNKVNAVKWINEEFLTVLTSKAEVLVLQYTRKALKIEEVKSVSDLQIIRHIYFKDSTNIHVPCYACGVEAGGMQSSQNLVLLGKQKISKGELLTWQDRVEELKSQGEWIGAMRLCLAYYEGYKKGEFSGHSSKDFILHHIPQLVIDYTEIALRFGANLELDLDMVASLALDFCTSIERGDVLFSKIYPKFCGAGGKRKFLALVEPYILHSKIKKLPPEVMTAFVEYEIAEGRTSVLEQCILRLSTNNMDFHRIIKLCRRYKLFSGLVYVYNEGLKDYRGPAESILTLISDDLTEKDEIDSYSYRLLLYLSTTLSGKRLLKVAPDDEKEMPDALAAKTQILGCLFNRETDYHLLQFLLKLDLARTLRMIRMVFEDKELFADSERRKRSDSFDAGMLIIENSAVRTSDQSTEEIEFLQRPPGIPERQEMVDVINALFEKLELHERGDRVKGAYVTFLARNVSQDFCTIDSKTMNKVFEFLFSGKLTDYERKSPKSAVGCRDSLSGRSSKRGTQRLLLKLLRRGLGLYPSKIDTETLLRKSEKANFSLITLALHQLQGNHNEVLDYYLKETSLREDMFKWMRKILQSTEDLKLLSFKKYVLERLKVLLKVDPKECSKIVVEFFAGYHDQIISELQDFPEILFNYLKSIMTGSQGGEDQNMEILLVNAGIELTPHTHEIYIGLLCRFRKKEVLPHLKSYSNYSIDKVLKHCQKYDVLNGQAYLLERTGDKMGSLKCLFHAFDKGFENLRVVFGESESKVKDFLLPVKRPSAEEMPMWMEKLFTVKANLQECLALCARSSKLAQDEESEQLWFWLLAKLLEQQRLLTRSYKNKNISFDLSRSMKKTFGDFLSLTLEDMMRAVPLQKVLAKLVGAGEAQFGDLRETIERMLANQRYEISILECTQRLLAAGCVSGSQKLTKQLSKAYPEDKIENEESKDREVTERDQLRALDIMRHKLDQEAEYRFREEFIQEETCVMRPPQFSASTLKVDWGSGSYKEINLVDAFADMG